MLRFRVLLEAFLHECLFSPLSPSFSHEREGGGLWNLLRASLETGPRGRRCSEALSRSVVYITLHPTPRRLGYVMDQFWYNPCSLVRFGRVPLWAANFRVARTPVFNGRTTYQLSDLMSEKRTR